MLRLKELFDMMNAKTKQTKMADYVVSKKDNSKKRTVESDNEDSDSKKPKFNQVDLKKINFNCDKKSANGQSWNLKVLSWNVAGLRAWLKVIKY